MCRVDLAHDEKCADICTVIQSDNKTIQFAYCVSTTHCLDLY